MAACGRHFATTRFEYIIVFISRTAHDSSLKFGVHINLNRHYQIQNKKSIDMMSSEVKGQKTVFCPFLCKYMYLVENDGIW